MAATSNSAVERKQAPKSKEAEQHTLPAAQSERMETIGRLASGVAHDFANLLTLISGYGEIALNRLDDPNGLRPHLEEILKAANRGARLTSQLLGFTRGGGTRPAPVNLNELAAETLRLVRPVIGEHMRTETSLAPNLPSVHADAGQMEQVLMNLVLNARDAMPRGGVIRIETKTVQWGEEEARAHSVQPGQKVQISVSDTGHGMDEATLARIFEPFYTTKENGRGTGIGLNTVQSIVRQSGGDVWARSTPGEGSTFTICLPAMAHSAGTGDRTGSLQLSSTGRETILVVEDEPGVRHLIAHALRMRGYRVIEAPDAEDALRTFDERGQEIDLILTDMVMPGKSGRELAELVLQVRPDMRLIFMSGYTDDVLLRTGALRPGMSFLQKPLRPETIAAKIREALDAPVRR